MDVLQQAAAAAAAAGAPGAAAAAGAAGAGMAMYDAVALGDGGAHMKKMVQVEMDGRLAAAIADPGQTSLELFSLCKTGRRVLFFSAAW